MRGGEEGGREGEREIKRRGVGERREVGGQKGLAAGGSETCLLR